MKLIIGNRSYSSWSLRGWLAARQSGLAFETQVIPLYRENWDAVKAGIPELAPSQGKVPVLWDGDGVVWDSLAILGYLSDKVGRDRYWPKADDARALARAMVAEMHSSFGTLRSELPFNLRMEPVAKPLTDAVRADVERILTLWAQARARFGQGGPFLFGTFGAADIFFAPVVVRFRQYGVPVPGFAAAYMDAVWDHEWLETWRAAAADESWSIPHFDAAAEV
ncbi:glutathione S-transferase family protein [Novosphingobium sp. AAP93]|uniref:glutathione S-transferase family protein n=1 Tax=Novosphingobium sp. AAP93 TaxID=1523427 RepID=UPI0006B9A11F|nr:glutathione S-transferase family protein [Novosphingobium sp. AAP93]KPF78137.1 glutathione S-transferase [Novosphingobium sp. AAP93]